MLPNASKLDPGEIWSASVVEKMRWNLYCQILMFAESQVKKGVL